MSDKLNEYEVDKKIAEQIMKMKDDYIKELSAEVERLKMAHARIIPPATNTETTPPALPSTWTQTIPPTSPTSIPSTSSASPKLRVIPRNDCGGRAQTSRAWPYQPSQPTEEHFAIWCQNLRTMRDEREAQVAEQVYSRQGVKSQKIYEEVKEELRLQGFCCGEYHPYSLTVISCEGDEACGIKPDDTFFSTTVDEEEYCFCPAHYNQDKNQTSVKTKDGYECLKENFVKKVNNEVESEKIVECDKCKKFWHEACRYSSESANQSNCDCSNVEIGFKYMPLTHFSNYLENKIMDIKGAFGLHVRVIRIKRETVRIGEHAMRKIYKSAKGPYVSYTKKKVMVFQKQDKAYVNFMTFTVKKFDHGWTVLNYLDSVQYLETDPLNLRSMIYKQVIYAYFDYAKSIGFHYAHIWANAPEKDGDFFFNVHPESQRWLEQYWLQKWYWDMLVSGALSLDIWTFGTEIDFSSAETLEELHQSLIFSSYWMSVLEEILSEESNKRIDVKKLKKVLSDRHKQNEGSLFYIDLIRKPWEQKLEIHDQDEEMKCSIAESREKWLNCQFENNLQFGTKRRAIHASTRLIQLVNLDRDEREVQYIYG
ncbi:hypothetical protein GCK72_026112 [Caenorhabditis remanei]|uniref:histone acetyltransferase n=1 Tax=Caenorhabditis remanei TaxID=31234 RepID=A0A6A5G4Y8_CAERE|nr:hypothetical protein GCK72_026112 [Caenorhabditis remanei]KAF1749644.1 hypothetical protein GCK72_026112 [Caenorhabditis remanei]